MMRFPRVIVTAQYLEVTKMGHEATWDSRRCSCPWMSFKAPSHPNCSHSVMHLREVAVPLLLAKPFTPHCTCNHPCDSLIIMNALLCIRAA